MAANCSPIRLSATSTATTGHHPYGVFTCRANDEPANSNFNDHRFLYARFDGTAWRVHRLAKAGGPLWPGEQDYVGGAAVDPQDRNIVYISVPIDPRDDAALAKHEIFKGVTSDDGATWGWDANHAQLIGCKSASSRAALGL